ncbi:restriction endonuclease subunit S [Roseivirga pacifica]|uniref:restriction endonuclease subunit S n=1 Tax=Roseivirga pacifica TaxID=1267423 RepID=UPI00227CF121|nr:restriction endonuclease subunit S [Roseivirga pacifica]
MSKGKKLIPELRFPEFQNENQWDQKSLGETGIIVTGKTPSTKDASLWDGEILFITPTDIEENRKYQRETARTVVENEKLNTLPIGSIAYTCIASIGKMAITTKESVTNQQINSIVVNKNNDNEFIYYSLLNITPYIKSCPATSTLPIINKTEFSGFKIAIPNPQEQQKIACCLSSLDELIAAHNDKLNALKDHKKGLLQNLFPQEGETVPKVRFPEFEGKGVWKPSTVEENCLVKGRIGYRGYTKQDLVKEGEGVLVLGGKNIQNQLLDLSDRTYLSWEKYYESPEIMVEMNYIIFSQRGTLGDCAIIDKEIGKATINPSMVLLRDITCNPKFLYYILIGDRVQAEVSRNSTSSAVPMLSQKQIREFSFLIPDPTEQEKIASSLSALDELLIAQQKRIDELQEHKKGLMQGLFPKIKLTLL